MRLILNRLKGGDDTVDALVRRALMSRAPRAGVVVSGRAAERLDLQTELTRPHGRIRVGRKIRPGLLGFLPLMAVFAVTPAAFGLLALTLTLADVL
ncbi:hypothetical protein ACFVYR_31990 [Streptomyces sp. NPDC058284]|uniref:hypothetical protein n=1 Tax=unclassified Streptomyces TaxID=2593676 RepID=UPI00364FDD86